MRLALFLFFYFFRCISTSRARVGYCWASRITHNETQQERANPRYPDSTIVTVDLTLDNAICAYTHVDVRRLQLHCVRYTIRCAQKLE